MIQVNTLPSLESKQFGEFNSNYIACSYFHELEKEEAGDINDITIEANVQLKHWLALLTVLIGFIYLVYGVFKYEWGTDKMAAIFPAMGVIGGLETDVLMENAKLVEAPTIRSPREKTGSTDFGNVMYNVPGSCIRVAFVPEGTSPHSQEYLNAGKSEDAHNAALIASKILAATCYDLISEENLLLEIKKEFSDRKNEMSKG